MKDKLLLNAIKQAATSKVKQLLIEGADANSGDETGHPFLMLAIAAQNVEIVRLLLAHGANPETNIRSSTALFIAVRLGRLEIVRLLIDAGVDVNHSSGQRVSALHKAALDGHVDIVRLLLDRGADVNAKQIEGTTALMVASVMGHNEVVRILLGAGADPNAKNQSGDTAFDLARGHCDSQTVVLLERKMRWA